MEHSIQTSNRPYYGFLKRAPVPLRFFLDELPLVEALERHGMTPAAAKSAASLFKTAASRLKKRGLSVYALVSAFWAPGRIEVLGKHTDYAGGLSLVAALQRGVCIVSALTSERQVLAIDAATNTAVDLEAGVHPGRPDWAIYPETVWRRVKQNFGLQPRGLVASFAGNLPPAAGMSSSSALMIAFFLAIQDAYNLSEHPVFETALPTIIHLSDYLGHVENGQTYGRLSGEAGVGTFGGSQDHAAIFCARAGAISQFSFRPTHLRDDVRMPQGYTFCLASSGVLAQKTGAARAAYNRAASLAGDLLKIWNAEKNAAAGSLAAVFRSPGFSPGTFLALLQGRRDAVDLEARLRQACREIEEFIPAGAAALRANDMAAWGRVVDQSQAMAESSLKNQVAETVFLAREARRLGAAAASAFGAGFGGSVWAMVERTKAEAFVRQWNEAYLRVFPQHGAAAEFFVDETGPGAFRFPG